MKHWWQNSIAIILAICFVWAGSGFNSVRYCCDDCMQAGIEHILNHSCDKIHHHNTPNTHGDNHDDEHQFATCCHHSDECTITRLEISKGGISHTVHIPEVSISDISTLPIAKTEILLLTVTQNTENNEKNTGHPIPITGKSMSIRHQIIIV